MTSQAAGTKHSRPVVEEIDDSERSRVRMVLAGIFLGDDDVVGRETRSGGDGRTDGRTKQCRRGSQQHLKTYYNSNITQNHDDSL